MMKKLQAYYLFHLSLPCCEWTPTRAITWYQSIESAFAPHRTTTNHHRQITTDNLLTSPPRCPPSAQPTATTKSSSPPSPHDLDLHTDGFCNFSPGSEAVAWIYMPLHEFRRKPDTWACNPVRYRFEYNCSEGERFLHEQNSLASGGTDL
ncbi:hypothetical protein Droror1_Dr00025687 [Drosera rotundifolia]